MYSHSMHGNAYLCIGTSGSIVVVVSPLIGLMMDQKAAFLSKGISAEVAGSLQGHASAESIVNGNAQLVFISPENIICNGVYRKMLQAKKFKDNLVALVVDEAHCIKTW